MPIALSQADGFALTMVGMLALSFGFVLLILVAIFRNGHKHDAEVENLNEGSHGSEAPDAPEGEPASTSKPPVSDPWEKDPDWWRG